MRREIKVVAPLVLFAIVSFITSVSHAQEGTLFGVSNIGNTGNSTSTLLSIDPETGTGVQVGIIATGLTEVKGLAFDASTRTLFGINRSTLISIDLVTGAQTTIGPTGEGSIVDTAFDPSSSTLFAAVNVSGADELITIDTATGSATSIGLTPFNLGAISFGPSGELFGIETSGADELVTIDPVTLAGSRVGELGLSINNFSPTGLAFDPSTNTFFSHTNDSLFAINPDTGIASVVGSTGFRGIEALVFVPAVPEPSTVMLLCFGFGFGTCGRSRHRFGKLVVIFLVCLAISADNAQAGSLVVIDFESPDVSSTTTRFGPFTEDGFTLVTESLSTGLAVIENDNPFFTGSQSITLANTGRTATITIDDANSSFIPLSIDIADVGSQPLSIPFTGMTVTGSVVNDTLTTDGVINIGSLDTLNFNITDALTSLTFTNVSPGFIFDNVVLDVVPVPEPSSLVLVAVGAGVFVSRRFAMAKTVA